MAPAESTRPHPARRTPRPGRPAGHLYLRPTDAAGRKGLDDPDDRDLGRPAAQRAHGGWRLSPPLRHVSVRFDQAQVVALVVVPPELAGKLTRQSGDCIAAVPVGTINM